MNDDRSNLPGAPSDDTTSALFVSARKKQLEEQEAQRRAKEKEEQRLAAEAEVQRLEREVEERRRRAEEEKRLADEESRRISGEGQAKRAVAGANPNAFSGSQQAQAKQPAQRTQGAPSSSQPPAQGTFVKGLLKNKKALVIIGGVAVFVIALAVVLIIVLKGGSSAKVDPNVALKSAIDSYGISIKYPESWTSRTYDDNLSIVVKSDYEQNLVYDTIMFKDVTWEYLDYIYDGFDPIPAGTWILDDSIKEFSRGIVYSEFQTDSLKQSADGWLTGGTDLPCTTSGGDTLHLYLEFVASNDRLLLTVIGIPDRKKGFDDSLALCRRIAATAELEYYPEYDYQDYDGMDYDDADYDDTEYSEPQVYYDLNSGIYFEYPDGWSATQASGASTFYVPVIVGPYADSLDRIVVYNYTPEFDDFVQSGNSGMDYLLDDFAYRFLEDAGYDYYDMYNVEFSDKITIGIQELILLQMENDEAYFYFYLIKILSDPQQVAAAVLETRTKEARNDFEIVINTLDLG